MLGSMHDSKDLGPALQRLREGRGLIQAEVAQRLGRSVQTISRLEQPGSNPQSSSLFRYLDAIGATLAELGAEMGAPADPLDEAVALVDHRLRAEPGYRRLARGMLERFGGADLDHTLRAMADLIDEQDGRLRRIEKSLGAQGEEALPDAPDRGPVER